MVPQFALLVRLVKGFLSALRSLSVTPVSPDRPPRTSDYVNSILLAGFKKSIPPTKLVRIPIEPDTMAKLLAFKGGETYGDVMFRAALSLAYFGALRIADYTTHLPLGGVEIHKDGKSMRVTITQTKTSHRKPVTVPWCMQMPSNPTSARYAR